MAGQNADKQGKKTVEMPTSAIGRMKADAAAKGRAQALKELDDAAKAAGLASFNDGLVLLGRMAKGGANGASGVAGKGGEGRDRDRRRSREVEAPATTTVDSDMQKQLDEARHEKAILALTLRAERLGLKNADFAVDKLVRKVSGMSTADAEKFDEDKFFAELQKTQPDVFGKPADAAEGDKGSGAADDNAAKGKDGKTQETKPAQTVANTGGKPTPESGKADDETVVDVTAMTDEQFEEYRAKHRF